MNCCDRILFLFSLFATFQFISRWDRDNEVVAKPWQIYLNGVTDQIDAMHSTHLNFTRAAISYGTSPIAIYPQELKIKDRNEVFINVHVKVQGPSMSFHRLVLTVSDVDVHEMHIFTHLSGYGSASAFKSIIMVPTAPLKLKYYFDETWNTAGRANVSAYVTIRSGHYKLWDVRWSDVYK